MQRQRANEARQNSILQHMRDDRLALGSYQSDKRVESLRHNRTSKQIEDENMLEKRMRENALKAERGQMLAAQDRAIAQQLQSRKEEALREEKMRQQLRENDPELRALQSKLKAAYMNKERAHQMAEKDLQIQRDIASDIAMDKHMEEEWKKSFVDEEARAKENHEAREKYRLGLTTQMADREKQKEAQYEEFLREKAMVDEIVNKILEEDRQEEETRLRKQHQTQADMHQFMQARHKFREAEHVRMADENRRIENHALQQAQRRREQAAARKQKVAERERVFNAQYAALDRTQAERQELDELRNELYMEEQEAAAREKEREKAEEQLRSRIQLRASHEQQMHLRAERASREAQAEDAFRKQMLEKFAEDDRIEQMNAQKRRMKVQEHRRQVEGLMAQRRMAYEQQKRAEDEERQKEAEFESYRKKIIEEERQKLIKEHAINLLGYLPKGVLDNDNDVDLLPEEVRSAYRPQSSQSNYGIQRGAPPNRTPF